MQLFLSRCHTYQIAAFHACYTTWCLKSEDKIELSWPEYIDVRCWQSSGWIWLEIFELSLWLTHVGIVYPIYRYSKYDYLLWWNSRNRKEWNEPKEFPQLQEDDQSSWIEKWKVCKILLQPLKMARNDKSEKSHGLAIARLLICAQEDFWIIPQEIRKTCLAKPSPSPKSTQNRVLWEPERLITLQKTGKK